MECDFVLASYRYLSLVTSNIIQCVLQQIGLVDSYVRGYKQLPTKLRRLETRRCDQSINLAIVDLGAVFRTISITHIFILLYCTVFNIIKVKSIYVPYGLLQLYQNTFISQISHKISSNFSY